MKITMTLKSPRIATIVSLMLAATLGCSTTGSRIRQNSIAFDQYPSEVQAKIQSGRIDKGFTEDMVYLAKGNPAEKSSYTRNGRKVTVWKYAGSGWEAPVATQNSGGLSAPYGYPGFGPGPSQPAAPTYQRRLHKIEFENGKVTGWDREIQID